MPKPTIVTRATKGSALTWTEGDQNLENLRDATITVKAGTGGTDVVSDLNGIVTLVAGTNVTLSGDNSAKTITINASGGGDIVNDTTPQLGGNLDVNGNSIVSASNGNISITPNGTGSIVLDGQNWPQADGTNGQVLTTNGSGQLSWTTASGGGGDLVNDTTPQLGGNLDVNGFDLTTVGNGNIKLKPNASGFGMVYAESYYMYVGRTDSDTVIASPPSSVGDFWIKPDTNYDAGIKITNGANATLLLQPRGTGNIRVGTGSADATITTISTYDLILNTNNGTSSGSIRIYDGANGNIEITPDGSGDVHVNADTLRVGDANSAATITTNGTGNLTLSTNNGTNSGTILINQGANSNITLSPNGTGIIQADKSIQIQATGDLRLADSDSSHYVGFKAPTSVTTNRIWTLPAADGTNGQVLSTNGSGTLSWATAGGSGPSTIVFLFSSPILVSGDVYKATCTEVIDTGNIASVASSSNFTLPAGTYIMIWQPHAFTSNGINEANNTNYQFNSISGNATITGIGRYGDAYQTASADTAIWSSSVSNFVLTQTSTFDFRWTRNGGSATTSQFPPHLTLIKVA